MRKEPKNTCAPNFKIVEFVIVWKAVHEYEEISITEMGLSTTPNVF
jgi:hypothetical protein